MAFAKERKKPDGSIYYEIRAYNKEKKHYYTKYYYPPDGWSARSVKKQLQTETEAFQVAVDAGEVLNREEKAEKEKERLEAKKAAEAEKAALKTVREYAQQVWMAEKELTLAETTRTSYQSTLDNYIYPVIGDMLLIDVTTPILRKLIVDFQKSGKAVATARILHVVLNQLFDSAFKDDLIPISPMLKIDRPRQPKDTPPVNEADKALDEAQLNYVLECVQKEPLKWQCYVNLSADVGGRRGELVGLQWSDVDWKNQTVTIRRNVQYTPKKGVYIATPKNGKERMVDIGQETIDLLKALRKEQKEQAKERAEKDGSKVIRVPQWIFTRDHSIEVMHPDSPTRYFKKFGERYHIRGFHPHLLRHSSASIAIRNGADVASVSRRLGHSSIEITMRTYIHANDAGVRVAGQSVRDALKRQREQKNKAKSEA